MGRRIALIVAKRDGLVLFGKRRDNGRWTLPGGHIEEGEVPLEGALRELHEETGLTPVGVMDLIDEREIRDATFYTFECVVHDRPPTSKNDPDNECALWAFFDVEKGIPRDVAENMAGPKDPDKNIAASVFGLAKSVSTIPLGAEAGGKFDYNHVLTPEHRAAGYSLHVEDHGPALTAHLNHQGQEVGGVTGMVDGNRGAGATITPHSVIDEKHRGGGLGGTMYEALMAHAYHNGIKGVAGDSHSASASRVHQKLSAKHGLGYKGAGFNPAGFGGQGSYEPYSYDLKSELPMSKVALDPNAGYTFSVEHDDNTYPPLARVWAHHGGRQVGFVEFNKHHIGRKYMQSRQTYVEPEHRRKGLASAMYAHAESQLGRKMLPSDDQTNAGRALWAGNRIQQQFGKSEGLMKSPDDDSSARFSQLEIDGAQRPKLPEPKTPQHETLGATTAPPGFFAPAATEVKRVRNRFVGGKATESTSKLGSTKRPMAQRQAFDYSHHLDPEHRAAGYALTVYHHPQWNPNPALRGGWSKGPGNPTPLYEMSKNGVPISGPAHRTPGLTGSPQLYQALQAAAFEHEQNVGRTVTDGTPAFGQRQIPFLDSLPIPSQFESRAQGLEIDKGRRSKKRAAETKAESGIGQYLDVGEGAKPLAVPTLLGQRGLDPTQDFPGGAPAPHHWDYSHLLPEHDRAVGRQLVIRHTPGLYDNYMNAQVLDGKHRLINGFAYPNSAPSSSYDAVTGHPSGQTYPGTREQALAMRDALNHHRQLLETGQLHQAIAPEASRFSQLELSERDFTKREQDDEVDRLLMHPNPSERSMALKLHGVTDKHLTRALADEDPGIQKQALHHQNLGHDGLLNLMQMPNREHLQHLALQHPNIQRAHVEALYHTHKNRAPADKGEIMRAISHHHALDSGLIEKMVDDGNGDQVVENLNTPPHVIERMIENHQLNPTDDKKRALARRALKHPHAPAHLVEHSFKNGPGDVKIAIAQGPHLPEALAQDVMQRGQLPEGDKEALLRTFIVQNPKASDRHLKTALKDRNPVVRHVAGQKTGTFKDYQSEFNKFFGHAMSKAVRAEDFKGVKAGLDAAGAALVDHKPDLEAHPPQHNADALAYKHAIIESPEQVKRSSVAAGASGGISRKTIYTVPEKHPTHGGIRYMVKPYHERISRSVAGWQKHPHQGWAEMTNQALYHAGGIGNLHQNVHVAEHNMGEGHEAEPALVIKMDPDMKPLGSLGSTYLGDGIKHDARKIAMMDFLSGNLDRHSGNIMVGGLDTHPDPAQQHRVVPTKVMAIDHSRSFQYANNHSYKRKARRDQPRELEDNFNNYVSGKPRFGSDANNPYAPTIPNSSLNNLAPMMDRRAAAQDPHQWVDDWTPAFDWWGQNHEKIKGEMNKRLEQIKDPEVRAHIKRNFDARTDFLDERSDMGIENYGDDWHQYGVPQYRPGEKTEAERERHEWEQRMEAKDGPDWRNK